LFIFMFSNVIAPHLVIIPSFLIVLLMLKKRGVLGSKSIYFIHICWAIFIIIFLMNFFSYHNNEYYAEILLFLFLISSMYIGIFCGLYFKDSLLNVIVIWVLVILIQLTTNNTLDQLLNQRWTVTNGWINSNAIGACLVFSIPFLIKCVNNSKLRIIKLIAFLEILTIIMVLFLLSSRGSLLSLSIIALFLFIMKREKIKLIGFILPILMVLIFMFFKIDILKESLALTVERVTSSGLNGREGLWSEAMEVIRNNPLYGIGARNGDRTDFHNPLLHITVHYGLLAVIPMAVLLISPIIQYIRNKAYKNKTSTLFMSVYIAIVAQSSLEAILTPLIMGSIGWYFIGFVYGYIIRNRVIRI
ncbi:O-antigen ligase family protein, partial [Priestia filamentosa]|uniref:O-antigen ligase family protein n=1 Tax=Priestia filamentosa TaxID=1402861 RepID=UPI0039836299